MNKALKEAIYDSLPEQLKLATSNFTGRERDIVLLSSLAVISALLPNVYGIYGRKRVYPNLYLLIIAPPASGKGVMDFSRGWAERIHQKILDVSRKEIDEYQKTNGKEKRGSPPLRIKIIPANISSAEIYSMIKNGHHGVVMIESEADTLSNMLNQDWGNFSDVMRKAFHHEVISISRKLDNVYLEIPNPKLSMVLSGTPDQVLPLVQSKENGLFSRFIYYTFNDISPWKNVFDESAATDYIKDLGDGFMYDLYEKLMNREDELNFKLTPEQIQEFNVRMKEIHKIVNAEGSIYQASFNSNVKRHGVIFFRLCMILSVIRQYESVSDADVIICDNADFNPS